MEALGANLNCDDPAKVLEFSEQVCHWGEGWRVQGNLKRHHPNDHKRAAILGNWFRQVKSGTSLTAAIKSGTAIKGLGVSFASKHLRHLAPERYAVLDDVLTQGLGYAQNPAGFCLFIKDLERLRMENELTYRIADLEAGIFLLTRQLVRASPHAIP